MMPISIPPVVGALLRKRGGVGGLVLCLAVPLAAQVPPQPAPTEKECRTALRIVEKGHPAKKEAWALGVAPRCPLADAVPALASMVRSLRTEADIDVLFEAMVPTREIVDEGLLLAALDVIGDNTATANSRIAMTFIVAEQISDGMIVMHWDRAISGTPGCGTGLTGSVALTKGAEPTVATLRSAVSRLNAVASTQTAPTVVRNAAACVRGKIEARLELWP